MEQSENLRELIGRCIRKDDSAWEELVKRCWRRVFGIAFKFAGSRERAEDLAQEILLKLFLSLETWDPGRASFFTWLGVVARNCCIDHYRAFRGVRRGRGAFFVEKAWALAGARASWGNPFRELKDREQMTLVQEGLDRLPDKLQEALVLHYIEELNYEQMAERLTLPEGTVKSRLFRGNEQITRHLRKAGIVRETRAV